MPSRIKMWEIKHDDTPIIVDAEQFEENNIEKRLESWIEKTPEILGDDLLIFGRQFCLSTGEKIDLIALDREGKVVIIEIKRDTGAREVIAQALDYESVVSKINEENLSEKAIAYFESKNIEWESLREAFEKTFENENAAINDERRILIVAPQLDLSTERMINYLATEYNIDINAITFNYYQEGESEYLVRNIAISKTEKEQMIAPSYPLEFHVQKAKTEFKPIIKNIFDFFKNKRYYLHSTKHYVTIRKDELDLGWITPRKTKAHIYIYADYSSKQDVESLQKIADKETNFEIRYSDSQVTKNNEPIVFAIRINDIATLGQFKSYQKEILNAIESNLTYDMNYEEIDKQRKRVRKNT